jgi:hypothetical protein
MDALVRSIVLAAQAVVRSHDSGELQKTESGDCESIEQLRVATSRIVELGEKWINVEVDMPDDSIEVLVYGRSESDEAQEFDVWMGYHDADQWYHMDGCRLVVTHWRENPAGPFEN